MYFTHPVRGESQATAAKNEGEKEKRSTWEDGPHKLLADVKETLPKREFWKERLRDSSEKVQPPTVFLSLDNPQSTLFLLEQLFCEQHKSNPTVGVATQILQMDISAGPAGLLDKTKKEEKLYRDKKKKKKLSLLP